MEILKIEYWKKVIKYKRYTFLEVMSALLFAVGLSMISTLYSLEPNLVLYKALFLLIVSFILYIYIKIKNERNK